MSDDAYKAGRDIAVKMWGEEVAAARESRASAFNRPFEDLVTKYCFGEVWAEGVEDMPEPRASKYRRASKQARRSLVRLASALPTGSSERLAILSCLTE